MGNAFFVVLCMLIVLFLGLFFSNVTTAELLRHLAKFSFTFIAMCSLSDDGEAVLLHLKLKGIF